MMMALILMTLLRKICRLNFSIVKRYLSSFGFRVRTAARKELQTLKEVVVLVLVIDIVVLWWRPEQVLAGLPSRVTALPYANYKTKSELIHYCRLILFYYYHL